MTADYCVKPYTYMNSLRIVYEQRKFLTAIPLIHRSSWRDGVTCLLINIEGRWAEKNTAGITVGECNKVGRKSYVRHVFKIQRGEWQKGNRRLVCHLEASVRVPEVRLVWNSEGGEIQKEEGGGEKGGRGSTCGKKSGRNNRMHQRTPGLWWCLWQPQPLGFAQVSTSSSCQYLMSCFVFINMLIHHWMLLMVSLVH